MEAGGQLPVRLYLTTSNKTRVFMPKTMEKRIPDRPGGVSDISSRIPDCWFGQMGEW
jgi:hypothetical protein